jgi:hypothetical protein
MDGHADFPWVEVLLMWDEFGRGDKFSKYKTLKYTHFETLVPNASKRKRRAMVEVPAGMDFGEISDN